ncbi:MAG: hypothetical protein IPO77_00520 [Acidobacteria bacterium]|nr:hypothetical protein [Acidobacteriota bacterium]
MSNPPGNGGKTKIPQKTRYLLTFVFTLLVSCTGGPGGGASSADADKFVAEAEKNTLRPR